MELAAGGIDKDATAFGIVDPVVGHQRCTIAANFHFAHLVFVHFVVANHAPTAILLTERPQVQSPGTGEKD